MKFRRSAATFFPLILLVLLVALTTWLDRAIRLPEIKATGKERHDPDYYVEDFRVTRYNTEGRLHYLLDAERMVHYPDDDTSHVNAPKLSYFRPGAPTSHLRADFALVGKDSKRVDMSGNVQVSRAAAPGSEGLQVTTGQMTVFPDDENGTAAGPVRVVQGKSVVTGVGMDFNNKTSTVVLHSRARATIDRAGK